MSVDDCNEWEEGFLAYIVSLGTDGVLVRRRWVHIYSYLQFAILVHCGFALVQCWYHWFTVGTTGSHSLLSWFSIGTDGSSLVPMVRPWYRWFSLVHMVRCGYCVPLRTHFVPLNHIWVLLAHFPYVTATEPYYMLQWFSLGTDWTMNHLSGTQPVLTGGVSHATENAKHISVC